MPSEKKQLSVLETSREGGAKVKVGIIPPAYHPNAVPAALVQTTIVVYPASMVEVEAEGREGGV